MNVLVTGGAGFIGSHVVEALLRRGSYVICLDNFDPYYDAALKRSNVAPFLEEDNFQLIEGDVRDVALLEDIIRENSVEYVVHEAAQPGVRASIANPLKTADVNGNGTLSVLCASIDSGVKKIVNASSSSVYGRVSYLPFDEEHPRQPISPYGASKLAAEQYCEVFSELYGLSTVSLRYFTVYGPRMRPDLAISIFTTKALKGEALEIYGDGAKTRDFTYISDAVEATLAALKKGEGTYNVGGGSRISIRRLAERIIRLTGSGSRIRYLPPIKGDAEHTMAGIAKAKRELRWTPRISLDEGLREFVAWKRRSLLHQ
jgi:UDP-glucose 4-epimerase